MGKHVLSGAKTFIEECDTWCMTLGIYSWGFLFGQQSRIVALTAFSREISLDVIAIQVLLIEMRAVSHPDNLKDISSTVTGS